MSPLSKPTIKVLIPNGLTPPLCVYRCCTPATYFVMYSIVTGSSTVRRCDCASNRALSTSMRASAFRPAKARQTCVSTRPIFEGVMRVSCSFMADRFSQPSTTMSFPLTPTAQVPNHSSMRHHWDLVPSRLYLVSQPPAHIQLGTHDHPDWQRSREFWTRPLLNDQILPEDLRNVSLLISNLTERMLTRQCSVVPRSHIVMRVCGSTVTCKL